MLLTCAAAVAVVWLAPWAVIRLEGAMAEVRLPGNGSSAGHQPPGRALPGLDTAAHMTRQSGLRAQRRAPARPSCPDRPAVDLQHPALACADRIHEAVQLAAVTDHHRRGDPRADTVHRCLIHAPNESVDPAEIEHMPLAEALFLANYPT